MSHLPVAKPQEIGIDAERLQLAYDLLAKWTAADGPMPAATLLVGRNGKMVEPKFFGRQGPEPDAPPIRRDSLFLLASITKPITYLAAMTLVERGELVLTERVTHYIPEFAAHHKEETLVLHLFTHTSGLPDMLPNNLELRRQHAPLETFIDAAVRDTVPLFPPGTNFSYQSMGTLVTAEIVQRLSGQKIAAFVKQQILDPLGLQSTSLGSGTLDRARFARLQEPAEMAGSDFGWNSDYWLKLGVPWGGLISTPEDLAVICQTMLNGGAYGDARIITPQTVRKMTTNRLNDLPEVPEPIRRARPCGLGWRLNQPGTDDNWGDLLGPNVFGHVGSTGTMTWMDPDRQAFFIVFTTTPRAYRSSWLVSLSNIVASAFV